ncbi:hypothetical protein T4E_6108, partial [Trichinella pseudospiralis]
MFFGRNSASKLTFIRTNWTQLDVGWQLGHVANLRKRSNRRRGRSSGSDGACVDGFFVIFFRRLPGDSATRLGWLFEHFLLVLSVHAELFARIGGGVNFLT